VKFSRPRRAYPSVELAMTPMVDLFLNILVFFLVATTFTGDTVFFVDLPKATMAQKVGDIQQVSIAISASGRVAFNNRTLEIGELQGTLEQIPGKKRASVPVLLRADRNAVHGKVVSVIDILREVGFQNVGIVTEAAQEREP
jgi:biopolymer transport protein ExbD